MNKNYPNTWHSIIVGAGASGLFCAGSYGAPKLLLEHNPQAGRKLNITGGGKCNFTNLRAFPKAYLCGGKHFCQPALAAFKPADFTALLEQAHIPFYEKEDGQLFAHRAEEITSLLVRRAREQHSEILFNTKVLHITQGQGLWRLETSRGVFYAQNMVLASGGYSYPSLGADGFAWRVGKELGLQTLPPRPALVSLPLPVPWRAVCRALAGNSLPAEISDGKRKERGMLLFTHEGISGPAVLQMSLYWKEGEKLRLNFLPDTDAEIYLKEHKNSPQAFSKILSPFISPKIAKAWLGELDVRAADAKKDILHAAARRLNAFEVIPSGTGGFTRAEVTAGGLDTAQFHAGTMECKTLPGLFVIGEALDVTGRLGGFNLHWAWASAAAAARSLAQR
ncbi:MAG TPA: aminoacetone oxidase family FAD-binding enzyme [Candidatus Avelusimicrobium excrementipullorum]|nr:aminoacetone oxidase family FAD-binding enzyme [Candidatus Avelusimicrobium excrementipullorum]